MFQFRISAGVQCVFGVTIYSGFHEQLKMVNPPSIRSGASC
jgi:hypothetical protein